MGSLSESAVQTIHCKKERLTSFKIVARGGIENKLYRRKKVAFSCRKNPGKTQRVLITDLKGGGGDELVEVALG